MWVITSCFGYIRDQWPSATESICAMLHPAPRVTHTRLVRNQGYGSIFYFLIAEVFTQNISWGKSNYQRATKVMVIFLTLFSEKL